MFPNSDDIYSHIEALSHQDTELVAKACNDLNLALYRGNYDKSTKSLKIRWVVDNLHKRIGNFFHQSDNYFEIIKKNIHPDDANLILDIEEMFAVKKSFVRQYRLLSDENFYHTFSEYVSVLSEDKDSISFVGTILMVVCGEYCTVFKNIAEQQIRNKLISADGIFGWRKSDGYIHCSHTLDYLMSFGSDITHIKLLDFIRRVEPADRRLCFIAMDDVFRRNNKTFSINVRLRLTHRKAFGNEKLEPGYVCISGIAIDFSRHFEPIMIVGSVIKLANKEKIQAEGNELERNYRAENRTKELKNKLLLLKKTEKQLIENLRKERELNKAKSLFVNMVSHEMRTPLAIIQGAADLIENHSEKLSEKDKKSYIQSIKKAILRMTRTMDAVLILGKVQNNQLSFQPIKSDIARFCTNMISEIENLNEGRRIVLQISKNFPRELSIDTTLLYHIASNLLSNAMKYSNDNQNVILKLTKQTKSLCVCVQDFGVGIPDGEKELIFNLFQRGSNIAKIKGIGIGMFIAKHCVYLHGGSIEVKSEENIGTTFKVTLPILE